MILNKLWNRVALERKLFRILAVKNGFKQGDLLFTTLFNFTIESALRKSVHTGGIIYYRKQQVEATTKQFGLYVDEDKTKYCEIKGK